MKRFSLIATLLFYSIVLLSLFCMQLNTKEIWLDETFTYFQVEGKTLGELFASFQLGVNAIPYLYFMIIWLLDQVVTLDETSLRLPSLTCSILTVYLLHAIIRQECSQWVAFVSTTLGLLFLPAFTYYSADARPYAAWMLCAVINLYTSRNLKQSGSLPYGLNVLASLLLPSMHYIGLVYSAILAIAFVVSEGKGSWQTATSFLLGWILFFLIHASQIFLFLQGDTLLNTGWIPTPTNSDFQAMIKNLGAGSGRLMLLCLVLYCLHRADFSITRVCRNSSCKYFILVSLGWLLIPVAFFIAAWVGLPNLTLERYYYPTALSGVLYTACLLQMFVEWDVPKSVFRKTFTAAVIACVILWSGALFYANRLRGFQQQQIAIERKDVVKEIVTSTGCGEKQPIITGNLHAYFYLLFYFPEKGSHVYLLRCTEQESTGWEQFHPAIQALTPDELRDHPHFLYLFVPGSQNNFPEFSIGAWAKQTGYDIRRQDGGMHPYFQAVFDARQMAGNRWEFPE